MAGVAQRGQAAAQRGAFGEGGPDPTTPSYATMFDNEPPAPQFTPAPVGRSGGNPGQPSVGAIKVFPNGRKARWDGMGWVPIQ